MTRFGRLIWGLAGLSVVLFITLFAVTELYLKPGGLDPFDSRFTGYTPGQARAYLQALSEAGNTGVYLGLFRQMDSVFPVLLAATFLGAVWLNTSRLWWVLRGLLMLFPLLYLWADLFENAQVAVMLKAGVAIDDATVQQADTLTRIKWFCVAICIMGVIGTWGFRRLTKGAAA